MTSRSNQSVSCEKTSRLSNTTSSEVTTQSVAATCDPDTNMVDESSRSSTIDREEANRARNPIDSDTDRDHLRAEYLSSKEKVADVEKSGMQDSCPVTTISDLSADLLQIVFQKMPSTQDLIKASLVSKQWLLQICDTASKLTKDVFGLFYCTRCKGTGQMKWKLACLDVNFSSPLQQSLVKLCMNSFSIFLPDEFLSCNDGSLLFFDNKSNSYYILNPYTNQWIRVLNHRRSNEPMSGLVSSRPDVQIVSLITSQTLKTYNAITETWNAYRQEFLVLGENDSTSTRSFILGNSVYRLSAGYLLRFDKELVRSFTIELPPLEDEVSKSFGCLGVSKELLHYSDNSSECVKVWLLLEGDNTWVLKYSFNLDIFLNHSCWCMLEDSSPPRVFSFHPFTDKLYIGNSSNIVSYDPGDNKITNIVSVDEANVIYKGTTHVYPLILNQTPLDVFGENLNRKSKACSETRFIPYTPGDSIRQNFWEEISHDIEDFARTVYENNVQQRSTWTIPAESFGAYDILCSHPIPKNGKLGILSLDIHRYKGYIAIGGTDADALVLDKDTGHVYSRLCGHSAKVNAIQFMSALGEAVATGSADKSVRLWMEKEGQYSCTETWSYHVEEVTAVTSHPSDHYMVSASIDSTWCLYDINSGLCIHQVKNVESPREDGYCCASFHPSGALLGMGTFSSKLKLWDVRTEALAAVYNGHRGSISTLSFAEYAYLLATAADDGVKIWDIRMNSVQSLRSYTPWELQGPVLSVDFGMNGRYLAVAGNCVKIFEVSGELPWSCLRTFPCRGCNVVKLGDNYAAVGANDGHVNIYGVPRV